jgi:hypothetical protein
VGQNSRKRAEWFARMVISCRDPAERRHYAEQCFEFARRRLGDQRPLRALVCLCVGLLWLSPRAGSHLYLRLWRSGYLRQCYRSSRASTAPACYPNVKILGRTGGGLGPLELLGFSKACFSLGLISAALHLRELALETGIATTGQDGIPHDLLGRYRAGETLSTKSYVTREQSERELPSSQLFDSLIHGRHVLLVGAATGAPRHPSAVRADTVVRLKFFGGTRGGWSDNGPPQTDIVYYLFNAAKKIQEELSREEALEQLGMKNVKLLVFSDFRRSPRPLQIPIRVRHLRSEFLQGTTQIGQRALLDILAHRPRRITLVGFDGYLSPQVRHAFRSELSQRTNFFRGLSPVWSHDIFGNRELLRNLRDLGYLDTDEQTAFYLDLSDSQYAQLLDERWRCEFQRATDQSAISVSSPTPSETE